jgi:hypothetical protein
MSNGVRCQCARCTCNGLMGPVVLITLGVLFLVGRMNFRYDFGDLWPILLVVIGLVKIASAMASTEGHVVPGQPVQPAPPVQPGQPGQPGQ